MVTDSSKLREIAERLEKATKGCRICGERKVVNAGRCNRCHLYFYRHGRRERPVIKVTCKNCKEPVTGRLARDFCSRVCKERYHQRTSGKPARNRRGAAFRQTERGKELSRQITKRQYAKHKDRAIARAMLGSAIKAGMIVKPKICERCSNTGRIEGHHHAGYDRKHWLDVIWLCKQCHVTEHAHERA